MKFEIKHRYSGELLFSIETDSWKLAIEAAIKSGANLSYANLSCADLSYADLSYAELIVFQFQQHWAYYTFDGSLRIGCICLPVSEWELGFEEIGKKEGYSEEQILMYGQFIKMCADHFRRNTKE